MHEAFVVPRRCARDHNLRLSDLAAAPVARQLPGQRLLERTRTTRTTTPEQAGPRAAGPTAPATLRMPVALRLRDWLAVGRRRATDSGGVPYALLLWTSGDATRVCVRSSRGTSPHHDRHLRSNGGW